MDASIQFFHNIPSTVAVKMIRNDEELSPNESWKESFRQNPVTAEVVKVALSRGPFVAFAKVGPQFYVDKPVQLENQIPNHPDLSVYGWKSDAKRKSEEDVHGIYEAVIVCGVQERNGIEHLYYVRAKEIGTDWKEGLGRYDALSTDQKVYVSSVRRFSDSLMDMYPPASNAEIEQGVASADLTRRRLQDECAALIAKIKAGTATVEVDAEKTGTNT